MTSHVVSELALPAVVPFEPRNGSEYYGAADVAAEYCGIQGSYPPPYGTWVHGWKPRYMKAYPELLDSLSLPTMRDVHPRTIWDIHSDNLELFRQQGWEVRGIGLPVAYLRSRTTPREPGTLLVMPCHSVEDAQIPEQVFAAFGGPYGETIARLRPQFSRIVVCVHQADVRKRRWIAFRDLGFEVIGGAHASDRNSLRRIQYLMSTFEFVTTNGFGSHLAYAAFFGARISIFGRFASYVPEDFRSSLLEMPGSRFIEQLTRLESEDMLRKHYPFLFRHPREAEVLVDWGREAVGYGNRVPPHELRELFHWRSHDLVRWQLLGRPRAAIRRALSRVTPEEVKQRLRALRRRRSSEVVVDAPQ